MSLRNPSTSALLLAAVAALLLLAGDANAQGPSDVEAYKAAVEAGDKAFDEGDYAAARVNYEKAHAINPDPVLEFNIGSTYRREGNTEKAIEHYERYLEIAPQNASQRGIATNALVQLREQQALEQEKKELAKPDRTLMYVGIGLAAGGVGALGFGLYRGKQAADLNDMFEGLAPGTQWTSELQSDFDRGESLEQQAIIASVVGGILIVGGGALFAYGLSKGGEQEKEPGVAVAPYTTGKSSGLVMTGSF